MLQAYSLGIYSAVSYVLITQQSILANITPYELRRAGGNLPSAVCHQCGMSTSGVLRSLNQGGNRSGHKTVGDDSQNCPVF